MADLCGDHGGITKRGLPCRRLGAKVWLGRCSLHIIMYHCTICNFRSLRSTHKWHSGTDLCMRHEQEVSGNHIVDFRFKHWFTYK